MKEKRKYVESTRQLLESSLKEKSKYYVKLLGKKFVIYPGVFSPKYFSDTEFFAKELPVEKGEKFLEIGCGAGIVSICAAFRGACVTSVDINPAAVRNTMENARLHRLADRINILCGDIYEPLGNEKFNTIFWNIPFGHIERKKLSLPEKALWDPFYKSTKRFISRAGRHLKPGGRIIIGFSSTIGHMNELGKILKSSGYKYRVIRQTDSISIHPVKFEIVEARLG